MTRLGVAIVGAAVLSVLLTLSPRSPVPRFQWAYLVGAIAGWWTMVLLGTPWPVAPAEALLAVLAWRRHRGQSASGM